MNRRLRNSHFSAVDVIVEMQVVRTSCDVAMLASGLVNPDPTDTGQRTGLWDISVLQWVAQLGQSNRGWVVRHQRAATRKACELLPSREDASHAVPILSLFSSFPALLRHVLYVD